jgi:hypothetical protein
MKSCIIFVLCLSLFSCKQEKFQKVDANYIAEKEFENLNLKEVDQFPLFKTCDETENREQQKACFEKEIHQWLKPQVDSLEYNTTTADTLQLYLSILKDGTLVLDSLNTPLKVKTQMDSIFKTSPPFYPAQKRGVPVKVSFQLPLILKVKPYVYDPSS